MADVKAQQAKGVHPGVELLKQFAPEAAGAEQLRNLFEKLTLSPPDSQRSCSPQVPVMVCLESIVLTRNSMMDASGREVTLQCVGVPCCYRNDRPLRVH